MRAVIKPDESVGCRLVTDRAEPDLVPGQVRVAVAATSVCGSDASIYRSTAAARELGLVFPVTMGHEVSGTVIEVAAHTVAPPIGTRVAVETHLGCGVCFYCTSGAEHNCAELSLLGIHVDGGFAERVVIPARSCFPLPEGMDFETGALLEPAGSAMHAVLRCNVPLAGASVLVTGGGPVGLVMAQIADALGARHVVVVEPGGRRRAMAEQRGTQAVDLDTDPLLVMDDTARRRGGYDVGFECSGSMAALGTLVRCSRREGAVMAVGLVGGDFPLAVTRTLVTRGLTLRGSFGRSLWQTWEQLSALVMAGKVDLAGLATHRLPLSGLPRALELMGEGAGKVMLLPSLPDDTGWGPEPRSGAASTTG